MRTDTAQRWEQLYSQTPLCDVPRHFASLRHSPFLLDYLKTVLRQCPAGGRTCEIGIGSGYGAIWLSLRGVLAEGIDYAPGLVERATQVNALLGGQARFRLDNLFHFYDKGRPRYSVVHHQGVLEHFPVPWIRAALAQQVAGADRVVFSVPSVYYTSPEIGDERLLPLEEWQRILEPFEVEELRYYGHAQSGERDHILGILRGQAVDAALEALMTVGPEPYPAGISAIVHTRNEARHIGDCLATLQGWTDEIIVCDMESGDATVEIARRSTDQIVAHPHLANFDQARNVSAMRARYRWVFYLDADERVPPGLGPALRALTQAPNPGFEGLLVPFRHHFAGRWMQCLYPGYTAPRLFKNGRFHFNARLHSGAQVDGRIACFPAENPDLALVHYSFDSLAHYLDKLNRYTDGEAANMHRDGQAFHWQRAIRHFVQDFQSYYDRGGAPQDGVHGFVYSFLSAFYRFEQHAKLYERRFQGQQLQPAELGVPASVEQVLEYALSVVRERPLPQAPAIRVLAPVPERAAGPAVAAAPAAPATAAAATAAGEGTAGAAVNAVVPGAAATAGPESLPGAECDSPALASATIGPAPSTTGLATVAVAGASEAPLGARVVWSGPLYDPSGYGKECRQFTRALQEAGVPVAAQELPWSHDRVALDEAEARRLHGLTEQAAAPGFVQVVQNFPTAFGRHPQAGVAIGRTMFETDRLPQEWVRGCNRMDYVWVPSEFNRRTFAQAGVEAGKLVVMPGCIDPAPFAMDGFAADGFGATAPATGPAAAELPPAVSALLERAQFTFLTVFDWTLHKGWDVLLRGFLEAFEGRADVALALKVWSTMGYSPDEIRRQAAALAQRELGHDLLQDARIVFVPEHLGGAGLRALYRAADAFVLPSRGEGWGRPYMEAMACGKPVIGTNWSGNTAFMTAENSYLLEARVTDVPEAGWREIPTYRGHRWAEPDRGHLRQLLQRVCAERGEAATIGARAREDVLSRFSTRAVGRLLAAEIERVREAALAPQHGGLATIAPAARTPMSPPSAGLEAAGLENGAADSGTDEDVADKAGEGRVEGRAVPRQSTPGDGVPEPLAVRWEGDFFLWHSLAHVNREFCLGLLATGQVEVSLVTDPPGPAFGPLERRFEALGERCFAPLSRPGAVHVRHFFPPRLQPPDEGHFVLMQPWEYGYLPVQWLEPIKQRVSEVWCYSRAVRDVYQASGIPEEKLHIVPLGVDAETFAPEAPPYVFTTEPGAARRAAATAATAADSRSRAIESMAIGDGSNALPTAPEGASAGARRPFTFLFVGGTIHRKGIDILLDAYLKAFTAFDDVCLVIKDTGTRTVYRDHNARERILGLVDDPTRPAIVYLEEDLAAHQLAGVYTACDCLVMPYRGEGFLLPALEALACGRPVIVPEGGPTDDFVDEAVGWRVAAQRKPLEGTHVGEWEFCGPAWQLEVDARDLARLLRQVAGQPQEAARRGAAGSQRVQAGWTWQHACAAALERLQALAARPRPRSNAVPEALAPAAQEAARLRAVQEAVQEQANPASSLLLALPGERSESLVSPMSAPGLWLPRLKATPRVPQGVPPGGRVQPTVSLCMIVRNEERVLGDCLASVQAWVDEVIVVDTGSTDRTVEIAQAHGAKVHHFPWCDDFSAARNESLRHATGDWIFWMDADDTIPEACGRQLRETALLAEARVTGFLLQVHIPPAPGETGFTVVDHVKLFRNRPELRFEGRIHEQILEPIYRAGGRVERTELYVVHSGYDYSPEGQQRKRERDFLLLEKDLADRPDHPFVLFNIGMTAYHLKDYAKALPALERCLALSRPQESTVRKVYAMLAGCHLEQKDIGRAKARVEEGLSRFPHDPELLFRAGIIYREAGDLAAAEQSYLKLLTAREVGHIDSLDVSMTGFKAHHNLALIYQDMGRLAEAEQEFQAAVSDHPSFVPSWLGLGDTYLRLRRFDDARNIAVKLQPLAPEQASGLSGRLAQMTG